MFFTKDDALIERINFLELLNPLHKKDLDDKRRELLKYFENEDMQGISARVLKNIVRNAFKIEELSNEFIKIITQEFKDPALAIRTSSLVAALYYVHNQFSIGSSKEDFLKENFAELASRFKEEEDVLKDFLELKIKHEYHEYFMHELISNCVKNTEAIKNNAILKRFGVKFQETGKKLKLDKLYIAKENKALKDAFKGIDARFFDNYTKKITMHSRGNYHK